MLTCKKLDGAAKVLYSLIFKKLKIYKCLLSIGLYVLVWGCFTASGPGQLVIIIENINSQVLWRMLSHLSGNWSRTWVMQQEKEKIYNRMATGEKSRPSWVARSELWPHLDWDALVREQFTPDITRISLNRKAFVKKNGAEFLLIFVQVWSAITGNVLWRSTSYEIACSNSFFPSSPVSVCMACLIQTWNCITVFSVVTIAVS